MRVAHVCIVTPGRCGLYETTRELVVGLRSCGVDSRLIDIPKANKLYKGGYPQKWDRDAPLANMDWAVKADVIVNHSGYDGTPIAETNQPVIHVAHGRPRSGFVTQDRGGTPIVTYQYQHNKDPRWKAVVTFWPEHVPYLQVMLPDKPVFHVPACVDLKRWTPGESDYDFHGKKSDVNIVCTDPRRDDNDAFVPINAFGHWKHPTARLHLYGTRELKALEPVLKRVRAGCIVGWSDDLQPVYRAAAAVITSTGIHTRSVREAMACGCPVVQVGADVRNVGVDLDRALETDRAAVRAEAETLFDPKRTAKQFKAILDDSVSG